MSDLVIFRNQNKIHNNTARKVCRVYKKNKTMKNNKIDVVGLAMVIVAIAITVAVVCVMLSITGDRGEPKEVSNGNIMICAK